MWLSDLLLLLLMENIDEDFKTFPNYVKRFIAQLHNLLSYNFTARCEGRLQKDTITT